MFLNVCYSLNIDKHALLMFIKWIDWNILYVSVML